MKFSSNDRSLSDEGFDIFDQNMYCSKTRVLHRESGYGRRGGRLILRRKLVDSGRKHCHSNLSIQTAQEL
ncbi:hypothetical protein J6590_047621 [Homalodisca vitripennis]|nr:hypothetical protein J6590_047621 [Homalodisca vitripennis]